MLSRWGVFLHRLRSLRTLNCERHWLCCLRFSSSLRFTRSGWAFGALRSVCENAMICKYTDKNRVNEKIGEGFFANLFDFLPLNS
jgi:hypothetical protein